MVQDRVAVYTGLFGKYDVLQDPAAGSTTCDFICFTDDETLRSKSWKIVHVATTMDPAMMNRHVKLHPHLYLPDHEVSIYIDSNLKVRRDPAELVQRYLTASAFAAPRHPVRNCIYDEIELCIKHGKTDAGTGQRQAERYRQTGYPARHGMTENRVLIRRHHDPAVRRVLDAWWAEYAGGIRRDQVSLPVVCWQQGFQIQHMHEDVVCGRYFKYRPHRNERLSVRAKIQVIIGLKTLSMLWQRLTPARYRGTLESPR